MSASVNPADPPPAEAGKQASRGNAPEQSGAKRGDDDDDEDEWRHEPVAPVDESNPLKSLGKAIGDVVTGSGKDTSVPPKR